MAEYAKKTTDDGPVADAKDVFELCVDVESDNRAAMLDDLKFARLSIQWDPVVRTQREAEHRPCLTENVLPALIRQVVNDGRQNKPAIKVHPADDKADPATAEVFSDLIRNIEQTSRAGIAYDTALDFAASGGVGYFTVNTKFADDDTFDLDLVINRVANPFSIYGDPYSTDADSSDWNIAFELERMTEDAFEKRWPDADCVSWSSDFNDQSANTVDDKDVVIAKYWRREETMRTILGLSSGDIVPEDEYAKNKALFDAQQISVIGTRQVPSHKVRWQMLSGADVLDESEWAGKYIPIVPVYGEEVNVEGKRYFRSLIRDAKDSIQLQNFWTSAATELVALAPRAPFIGPKEAFKTERKKWETANTESHSYIGYDGSIAPQRQPFAGIPAGALQMALNASDAVKRITGIHDANQGAPGNETSGKAILMRQREGDVSTFHLIDNLSRAIEHGGRILVDLIPKVYTGERIARVIGVEGDARTVTLNSSSQQPGAPQAAPGPPGGPQQQVPQAPDPEAAAIPQVYNLTVGKYDLTVTTGPSFTTRREEAAQGMIALIQAYPEGAPILAPDLIKNLDWPGADKIAQKFEAMQANQGQNSEAAADMAKVQQEGQIKQAQMQQHGELKQAELAQLGQQKQAQMVQEAQLSHAQLEQEGQLKTQQMQQDMGLQLKKLHMEMALKQWQTKAELDLDWATMEAEAKIKEIAARNNTSNSSDLDEPNPGGTPG